MLHAARGEPASVVVAKLDSVLATKYYEYHTARLLKDVQKTR